MQRGDYGPMLSYATLVTLTAPNGGKAGRNSRQYIRWNVTPGMGNLSISLWQNSTQIGVIADNVNPAAGAYAWNVGTWSGGVAPLGTGYTIRIQEKGTAVSDEKRCPLLDCENKREDTQRRRVLAALLNAEHNLDGKVLKRQPADRAVQGRGKGGEHREQHQPVSGQLFMECGAAEQRHGDSRERVPGAGAGDRYRRG